VSFQSQIAREVATRMGKKSARVVRSEIFCCSYGTLDSLGRSIDILYDVENTSPGQLMSMRDTKTLRAFWNSVSRDIKYHIGDGTVDIVSLSTEPASTYLTNLSTAFFIPDAFRYGDAEYTAPIQVRDPNNRPNKMRAIDILSGVEIEDYDAKKQRMLERIPLYDKIVKIYSKLT